MRVSEVKTLEVLFGNLINIKTFFLIFLFTLSFSWLTDGIAEALGQYFNLDNFLPIIKIVVGLAIAIVLFILAKNAFENLKTGLDVVATEPEKTKNLILFLSSVGNDKLDIIRNAKSLEDIQGKRISWEMPAIAIHYHIPKLENVVVITSPQSEKQFKDFKNFIERIFPNANLNIEKYKNSVNFEDIEKVYDALEDAFYSLKRSKKAKNDKDIMIDVTGGQKIQSIAGAIFTLETERRKFQYISTNTKKVIGFDILKVRKEEF